MKPKVWADQMNEQKNGRILTQNLDAQNKLMPPETKVTTSLQQKKKILSFTQSSRT